ncbi:MAG: tetratricopeptide repeat protein [Planctomycetota bacterium]
MTGSADVVRGRLLLAQSRPKEAEEYLRRGLGADPSDAEAHALLALALGELKRPADALREARLAIRLAPDLPYCHYVHASVLSQQDQEAEAEQAAREAVRLDPEDADYHALLAAILYDRRRWAESLEAAETGLRCDPQHVLSLNVRAMALVKLGRRTDAAETLASALAHDPHDDVTHANRGWALLHSGKSKEALEAFREALRLNPQNEFAREGIIQALRARNIIYRLMLLYFLWMGRLSRRAQWGLLIGAYIGYRMLRTAAQANPTLTPYVRPVLVLYLVFVFLSWTAGPLFDLLLRLSRFGRLALTPDRIQASNWVGGLLLSALLLLGAFVLSGFRWHLLLLPALINALLIIPVSAAFGAREKHRRMLKLYAAGLALAGYGALMAFFFLAPTNVVLTLGMGFLIGTALLPWIANALALRE